MKNKYRKIGIDFNKSSSGNFLLDDSKISMCSSGRKGLEVMSLAEAEKKDVEVLSRKWSLIDKNTDETCRRVSSTFDNGYFVRSKKNTKVDGFVQTCLSIKTDSYEQNVHNMVVVGDGSEMHVVTGCMTLGGAKMGRHNGVTEIFVGKGAKLTYTMIHSWSDDTVVRPKTVIRVDELGQFVSNYVCIDQVGDIEMYPKCVLAGKGAFANMNSYILAKKGSKLDIGAGVTLLGESSRCLVKAKIIAVGGQVINRGILEGKAVGVVGHLDCSGLIVGGGLVDTIPEIRAELPEVNLTHEASVGRVSVESIEYLQSRGFSAQQALALILRGFLDLSGLGVPELIIKRLDKMPVETGGGL